MGKLSNKNMNVAVVLFVLGIFRCFDDISRTPMAETALVSTKDKVIAADLDNHQSLYPYAYLSNSTANYTWVGNHWFPNQDQPMDEPTFTPSEILRVFQTENTLWFGESTCRQDYHTMYHMLNTDWPNSVKLLQKYINKGKRIVDTPPYHPPFYCPARTVPNFKYMAFKDLAQLPGTDHNCSVETNDDSKITVTDDKNKTVTDDRLDYSGHSLDNRTGKFDYIYGKCLPEVLTVLSTYRNVVEHEYSVLILSLGLWEISKPEPCDEERTDRNVTVLENVVEVLDFLHELSGPSLFVVWKTHGQDLNNGHKDSDLARKGDAIVQTTRDWFLRNEPKYMDLADFRLAVDDRTWGEDRIKGDMNAHWGLDARLLSLDLLSRIVYRKQKRGIEE